MALPKNCDARKNPSASRQARRDSCRPVEAQTANFSEDTSYSSTSSKLLFAEDFTMEHSLPGLRLSTVEISICF